MALANGPCWQELTQPDVSGVSRLALRCATFRDEAKDIYQLPADKYDQWRDVTLTFDPLSLRIR